MALMNAMSIGFSVPHTSGEKEASRRRSGVGDGEHRLGAEEQPPAHRVVRRQRARGEPARAPAPARARRREPRPSERRRSAASEPGDQRAARSTPTISGTP